MTLIAAKSTAIDLFAQSNRDNEKINQTGGELFSQITGISKMALTLSSFYSFDEDAVIKKNISLLALTAPSTVKSTTALRTSPGLMSPFLTPPSVPVNDGKVSPYVIDLSSTLALNSALLTVNVPLLRVTIPGWMDSFFIFSDNERLHCFIFLIF